MKRPFKILVLSLSVIGTTIFGLDKIGVTPIAPGYDVGFQWSQRSSPGSGQLILLADAGDLNCWVSLKIRGNILPGRSMTAKLSTGRDLAVAGVKNSNDWTVEIFDPAKDGSTRTKFLWPSGIQLMLYFPVASASDTSLLDWRVYLKDKESDSLSKASWRNTWFWVSIGLLGLSIIGGIYGIMPERPEPFSPQGCIEQIIDNIEGSSPRETKKMRVALQKVAIEGANVNEALEALGLKGVEKLKFWFAVRKNFLSRLRNLIENLHGFVDSVESK